MQAVVGKLLRRLLGALRVVLVGVEVAAAPTQRAIMCESEPEPVPASITTQPGSSSSCRQIIAMSALYRICVRCETDAVHSSALGRSR